MLIAAMNPCPCGYFTDPRHTCRCTSHQIHRYRSKISGPLLDRIDIHLDVPAVSQKDLMLGVRSEPSDAIRKRVVAARRLQNRRMKQTKIYSNAQMASRHIRKYCRIGKDAARVLESAIDRLGLSARAYNRILKISRTIADLEAVVDIQLHHVMEAIQYRSLDRSMPHSM
jgi:magnesium chelatase family protein